MKRLPALAFLLVLGSCAGPSPPSLPPGPPDASVLLSGGTCLRALADNGVVFDKMEDFGGPGSCGVRTAISLRQSTATMSAPVTIGCTLAFVLNSYERQIVQPAARRHFGQPVARIRHMGGYACRERSSGGGRLSEHALGKAIDIGGFELADGTIVDVEDDWSAGGHRQAFLREISSGACRLFSVVLTPNHDSDHHDHIHLDIGPWRLCGT